MSNSNTLLHPTPAAMEYGARVLRWKLAALEEAIDRAETIAVATQTGPAGSHGLAQHAEHLKACIRVLDFERTAAQAEERAETRTRRRRNS